jgi:hypothetical protein
MTCQMPDGPEMARPRPRGLSQSLGLRSRVGAWPLALALPGHGPGRAKARGRWPGEWGVGAVVLGAHILFCIFVRPVCPAR